MAISEFVEVIDGDMKSKRVVLCTTNNASAAVVYLYEGQIRSWKVNNKELLYRPKEVHFEEGNPIPGGIGISFPIFEGENSLDSGFARNSMWVVDWDAQNAQQDCTTKSYVHLLLRKHGLSCIFELRLKVVLTEEELTMRARVRHLNADGKDADFQFGFLNQLKISKSASIYYFHGYESIHGDDYDYDYHRFLSMRKNKQETNIPAIKLGEDQGILKSSTSAESVVLIDMRRNHAIVLERMKSGDDVSLPDARVWKLPKIATVGLGETSHVTLKVGQE